MCNEKKNLILIFFSVLLFFYFFIIRLENEINKPRFFDRMVSIHKSGKIADLKVDNLKGGNYLRNKDAIVWEKMTIFFLS